MADAFKRLTKEELGQTFTIDQAELLGPFDHFYNDHVFSDNCSEEFGTHYVAIAYVLTLDTDLEKLPLDVQHCIYQWFELDSLLTADTVHKHTKNYFI